MKKFLQKTLALLALCLVSMGAWAETVSFDLTSLSGNFPVTKEGVTVTSTAWAAEIYSDFGKLKVEGVEADITQIVLNMAGYDGGYCAINANTGSFSGAHEWVTTATWLNSDNAKSVEFCSAYPDASYIDFNVTSITVTYTPAAPSTTFAFTSSSIAEGSVYTEPISSANGLNLYHSGTLQFADGKSVADITVNGNPMDSETHVGRYNGSTWISYTFAEDGANAIVIPEGVFENEAGKTNEAFTINFTLNLPGITMTEAGWTTFCNNTAWKMPEGYEGYVVSDIVDGVVVATNAFHGGDVVPASYGVMISGPEATKVCIESSNFYGTKPVNYLYRNVEGFAQNWTGDVMCYYEPFQTMFNLAELNCFLYKLSYDSEGENLGFYWDSADGQSLTCQPKKAFLVVPETKVPAGSNGLKIRFADDEVTGINAVATEKAEAIYNLQGQRVNANAAGVYVKNGKKFIVK